MPWENAPETNLVTLTPDHKEAAVIKAWLDGRNIDAGTISKIDVRRTKSFEAWLYTVYSVELTVRFEPDLSTLPGGNRRLANKVRHLGSFIIGRETAANTVLDQSLAALVDAEII